MQELTVEMALVFRALLLSPYQYRLLRKYLDILPCRYKQYSLIYTPLIQEIHNCLPKSATSIHFSMISRWTQEVLPDLAEWDQEILHQHLGRNQAMKDQLIIGFDNSRILRSLHSTNAPVSLNSTKREQNTGPQNQKSQQSLSLSVTSLEKLSNLRSRLELPTNKS